VAFHAGSTGLVIALVNNAHAMATITLAGAHVMAYTRHGEKPLFWASPSAAYNVGESMRGGAPVCWPWFAGHPTDPQTKPMHGLVRAMPWSLAGTRACPDGSTELRMIVRDTPVTRTIWPHAFELEAIITVGRKLRVEWTARSREGETYTYTGALHPYFAISDIPAISIHGLERTEYLDKTDQFRRKTQAGPLQITEETDRIFLDTTAEIAIIDPGWGRTIRIAKEGSRTSVVWNPDCGDALLEDVGAGQHRGFVCVEAANAAQDVVTVSPDRVGRLVMEIWTEQGAVS